MSLFQCEVCGCRENTALAAQGFKMDFMQKLFDWSYAPERKEKLLCSACGPTHYRDGTATKFGVWHEVFPRVFLPLGQFKTNAKGDLEHTESGSTNVHSFAISESEACRIASTE